MFPAGGAHLGDLSLSVRAKMCLHLSAVTRCAPAEDKPPFTIYHLVSDGSLVYQLFRSSTVVSFAVSNPSSDLLSPLGDPAEILRSVTVFVPAIILVGGMLSAGNAGASAGVN